MELDGPDSPCNNSDALVGVSVLHGAVLCYDSCTLGNAPIHIREKDDRYNIYLIRRLYNLRMKESDFVTAQLSAYETIIVQLSSQGMTIEEELRALILLSSLPPSWETFVTMIYNASSTTMTYAFATRAILSEDARRKSFEQNTSGEAYAVQDTSDRHHRSRSSSRGPSTSRSRSKSCDKRTCNYCKSDCQALKTKNEKAQRAGQPNRTEELNYCGLTSTAERSTTEDTHILTVESITEAEVLLTTEESASWLLESGASYHVTPFWS